MQVRLSHIAERAGVSVATVSRVLNEKPGVNAATRRAVLSAVDVLGYERPSRLRAKVAGLVGLIVPELANPIFPKFAEAVSIALARHGYTPVLCSVSAGGIHEDAYVRTLRNHGVAGIIFVSGIHAIPDTDPDRYRELCEAGLPLVLVNGYLSEVDATFISYEDATSVDLAVGHLAQMGHTRIGLALGQDRYTPTIRKRDGFARAMRRHVDESLTDDSLADLRTFTTYTVEGGTTAAHALLDRGVTGIVCGSDLMALGAVRAARQRGMQVPEQVSVVGSDDSLLIEFTDPPLTTVRQPVTAIGNAAAQALLDQIAGAPPAPSELFFRPELIVRGSSARAPQD
ncbi:LacI family DNA-binding transcriptional regulator [Nocardioides sp.]|uniref:LacI family DNA-binding transcriptional regulator n=1 Tax=Nocardioides sp. TaxID=35761 RepID=UPI002733B56E|nr:LacI family DNA-binding transcriptional regulator [Nocardioides sp.]MDP3891229.1 LacI family DNA-binding transcriptional regulator [Nocardioides sp.]